MTKVSSVVSSLARTEALLLTGIKTNASFVKVLFTRFLGVVILVAYCATYLDLTLFSGQHMVHCCGAKTDAECCCCKGMDQKDSDPMCTKAKSNARTCTCGFSRPDCHPESNAHLLTQNRDISTYFMGARLSVFPRFSEYARPKPSLTDSPVARSIFHPPCS